MCMLFNLLLGMASHKDKAILEKELQRLSNSFNSVPKMKVPKKHILHNNHYTKEFLLSNHPTKEQCQFGVRRMTLPDAFSNSKMTVFGKQDLKKYENSYTPIKIHDMAPGVVNRERILYAKASIDGVVMTSLHTVIEDEYGGACKLCVYNLSSVQTLAFRKGVKMAILNPYYKKAADGTHMMRVDNPMEVILVQPDTPSAPFILPIDHKLRGNQLFREGRYLEAVEEYSQAIMGDRRDPLFYSNRSLCYANLSQFEAALSDATAASDIDPTNDKFKYRAAVAWSGLGNPLVAIEILGQLVETARENSDKQEYRDRLRAEHCYLAQQRGEVNLRETEQLVLAGIPVQMGDYIGPLELRRSGCVGCADRGLFATRDIRRGEVVHVSKAAVYLSDCKLDITTGSLEVSPTGYVSPPYQILVSKLIQGMNKSKLFAHRVLNLVEDKKPNKSPFYTNIELYTHNGYEVVRELDSPEFSIENIRDIATKKAFSSMLKGSNNLVEVSESLMSLALGGSTLGMWFIPSLVNHSCVGNLVRVVKGEVCVLKVFREVKAGEELVMSLFEGSYKKTLRERKKTLKSLQGYVCHCLQCKYESEPNITPLLARVCTLYDQVYSLWRKHGCNSPARRAAAPLPVEKYRGLVARAIELADELGLGPQTFCGTIWSSFMDLTCIVSAPAEDQLYFIEKIKNYLSELEVYHQFTFWKNYHIVCMEILGVLDPRTKQAEFNSVSFEKLFKWE